MKKGLIKKGLIKKGRWQVIIGAGLLVLGSLMALYVYQGTATTFSSSSFPVSLFKSGQAYHEDGREYTIRDQDQKLISKMSRVVSAGDELITGEGKVYKINQVDGLRARAEYAGMDKDFVAWQDFFNTQVLPVAGQDEKKNNRIAIYHTHSEECYVPTDGTESIPGGGGIYQVGSAMVAELKKKGVDVIHDTSNHSPRDNNAYYRSRRTATRLMGKNPIMMIDVHRDGIPDPDFYNQVVDGENVTQMRLVVGSQNPKMQSNKDFSKQIMAAVNERHPGLIKEIFIANGNYNQDLMSTAMLTEVGTYTNTREAAEKGAALFADALPDVLGIGKAGMEGISGNPNANAPSGWSTIGIIVAVLVLGGGAFLLISAGSWDQAKERLRGFFSQELMNLLAPKRNKRRTGNQDGVHDPGAGKADHGEPDGTGRD